MNSFFGRYERIPEEWNYETIEDCCKVLDSNRIPLNSNERKKIQGNIPYYGANGILDHIDQNIFDEDLVLLAEDGGYFSEYQTKPIAQFVTGKSWVNNHAHVLANKSNYNLKFIFYSLVHKNIMIWISGSTRTKLNQSELRRIKILIPTSKVEQQKIASILSGVDALIESTQHIIEKTERLKKGLMQKLLTRGIGHTKFKKAKWLFGKEIEIPQEWNVTRLIEQCIQKPEYGAGESAIEKDLKLPRYIRITDLNDDGSLRNKEWKSIKENAAKDYLLNNNDILFARTGATVGKSYLYADEDGRCAFAGYLIRFQPDQTKLNSKFLFHYIHSIYYWKYIKSIQTWGVQPNVNAEQYSNLLILLSPIHEQQKIASILSGVDARRHRDIIALIILRIKLAIFLILFVGISVNACKNILVAVQVMDRPLCETVLRTL